MMRVRAIIRGLVCLLIVISAGLWWIWSGQKSRWEARAYPINGVAYVDAAGGCIMAITQGGKDTLVIEGKPESLGRISVDQTGSLLTLRLTSFTRDLSWRNWLNLRSDSYRYVLQLRNLQQLKLDDACIATIGDWRGDDLSVHANQASKVNFGNLTLNNFSIEQRQASHSSFETLTAAVATFRAANASNVDIYNRSNVGSIAVYVGHASHFDGKLLYAQHAQVEADHASDVEISVVQQLDVKASYASDVDYWGAPKTNIETIQASNVNAHAADN